MKQRKGREEAASLIPDEERKRKGKGKEERALRLVLEQWISLRYRSGYR
jgi:hypothetical protein